MTTTDTYRGVGIDCRRGRHDQCAAPRACRCDCHPLDGETEDTQPPAPYTCDVCGKVCQNGQGLAAHRRSHLPHELITPSRPTASIVDRLLEDEPESDERDADDDETAATVAVPDTPSPPAELEPTFQRLTVVTAGIEAAWPHNAAARYINLLIDTFHDSAPGPARWEIADRIERILGLHERTA